MITHSVNPNNTSKNIIQKVLTYIEKSLNDIAENKGKYYYKHSYY